MGRDFNCTEGDGLDWNHTEPHAASQHAIRWLSQALSVIKGCVAVFLDYSMVMCTLPF